MKENLTMNKKTNLGLVQYCKMQVGSPYWYGTFGQLSTEELLKVKRKQYPRYYIAKDFEKQFGRKVHDCIGLIKGYMWCENPTDVNPKYQSNGFKDISADMLWNLAKCKGGSMSSMPDIPGITVHMKGHVGVYIGNGEVIEARGHAFGVVVTKLKDRKWNKWAFINEIEYNY